jgi:tetratricopeptide (TPR) repeat protein
MSRTDRFGAPVSHGNQAEIDTLNGAAVQMLRYAPDPTGMASALLESAPDFVMARCFLARAYLTASDKRRRPLLVEQYDELTKRAHLANDREAGHIEALGLWLKGDFLGASHKYGEVLGRYPRDLIALQYGHQTDFLLGQATSTRDRPARALPHWSEADEDYSYVLGMRAFGLEEAGHYAEAEDMAWRCVNMNHTDSWGVHALAHCLEMQGKAEEGIRFMNAREADWGQDSYMTIHNRWHLGLYHLERAEFAEALALHDQYMGLHAGSELMDMHDSAAMLWRLGLDGVDVGNRWAAVAVAYAEVAEQSYMAFTDIHAMMAFVSTERWADADRQMAAMKAAAAGTGTNAQVIAMVGLPLVKGFRAFGEGKYQKAADLLSAHHHMSHMIGGSMAQRDILNLTLLAAYMRLGDKGNAKALIAERTLAKPESPLTELFDRRVDAVGPH